MLDNVVIGISMIGPKMEIIWVNKSLKEWFPKINARKKPLCYRSFYLPPKKTICDYCPTIKAFRTGEIHSSETGICADGRRYNVIATPVEDGKSKVCYVVETVEDITDRKHAEEALKASEAKLREQKKALEQKNIALSEIIQQIEVEKTKIKQDIAANVNEILIPILAKLKIKRATRRYVDLLQYHLQELSSSFGRKIIEKNFKLTSREIEICNMIKGGLTSKEISGLLNISYQTVEKHRRNIRHKAGISNKDINLTSFLHSL